MAPGPDSVEERERAEEHRGAERPSGTWALPDLIVIDGGKGQLGSAMAALRDAGLDPHQVDLIALAKERALGEGEPERREPDRIFLPRAKDPIRLRPHTAELFLLSRIRDEAHRFAVTFHGKQRQRATLRSQLADVPGVGPKRQQALLRAFGSVRRIRSATREELLAVPGLTRQTAEALLRFFGSEQAPAAEAAHPTTVQSPGPTEHSEAARPLTETAALAISDDPNRAENAAAEELEQFREEADLLDEELQQLAAAASLRDPHGAA